MHLGAFEMNLEAKTPEEALETITGPIMYRIKDIDIKSRCNPTTFYNGVLCWFDENAKDCPEHCWIKSEWVNCMFKIPYHEQVKDYRKAKEAHRLFRFKVLHHYRLITFKEYDADWLKFWEMGI